MKKIVNVEHWLRFLGKTHAALLDLGLDPRLPFITVYPGDTEFYLEPEPGVSYKFDTETAVMKAVIITFIRRVELEPEFNDILSPPYACTSKHFVREVWGDPVNFRAPVALPQPIGKTGGWDAYELSGKGFAGVELMYQYTSDFETSAVIFRAKEK
ncbi:hypothetical protein [Pseudomonas sp. BP8]|uniref:hypothetical protein n=1 Tax=Pseudomonas sp. BP8 TaxID=2817864 RepID=UPI001AE5A389|nr:hypothetical protein [Pseudomonas sp. BP8]MBP2259715.1 hypothetical protein [Pseudomonas sp. BP8]HDS1734962.1 hypothetical protein [Pseudomonas putida]